MIDDDIQIQRDRKEVIRVQDEVIGRQPIPDDQIELPLSGPYHETDVLGGGESNWADQQIITSDDQLSEEEIGLLPEPQGRPAPVRTTPPLWTKLAPYRPPIVTNPKQAIQSIRRLCRHSDQHYK